MPRAARVVGRASVVLLAIFPLAGPVVAGGAGCPHKLEVFLVRRVGKAPRPLQLSVVNSPQSDLATLFVVTVRWQGGKRIVPGDGSFVGTVINGVTLGWFGVYAQGGLVRHPAVTSPPVTTPEEPPDSRACPPPEPALPPALVVDQEQPTTDEFIVGAYDENVQIQVSPGWTVTRTQGGAMRMVTGSGSGTGVQTGAYEVEYFQGTPAVPGGPWGSVAFAHIPCMELGHPLRSGMGAGTLVGGGPVAHPHARTMSCGDFPTAVVGGTSGPTTWYVSGEAVGTTSINRRLVVFDLPRP